MTRSYTEYQKEKQEREWQRRVDEKKKKLGNAERVDIATRYKATGNDKFKSGNVPEAIDYYREALEYVHDLVDARRKERAALVVPLHLNLSRCYADDDERVLEHATKAIKEAEVSRNEVNPSLFAKALMRRGLANFHKDQLEAAQSDIVLANKVSGQFQAEGAELLEKIRAALHVTREQRKAYGGFFNKKKNAMEKPELPEGEKTSKKPEGMDKEVAQKAVKGLNGKLYEDVDKAMEPAREKERDLRQQLELEKDLMGVIDESHGKKSPATFDKFMDERSQRFDEQEEQLDQKKKVLNKLERERKWGEDEDWAKTNEYLKEQRMQGVKTGGWTEKNMSRWAKMQLRETTIGLALESKDDLEPNRAAGITGELIGNADDMCIKALICDCVFAEDRDEAAIIFRPGQKPLHYWDFQLTFDWEVVVCKRGGLSYRSASDLIKVAADSGNASCPPNITEHCVLRGEYFLETFASDESGALDEDTFKPLSRILKRGGFGTKVESWAEDLHTRLIARLDKRLDKWIADFCAKS